MRSLGFLFGIAAGLILLTERPPKRTRPKDIGPRWIWDGAQLHTVH